MSSVSPGQYTQSITCSNMVNTQSSSVTVTVAGPPTFSKLTSRLTGVNLNLDFSVRGAGQEGDNITVPVGTDLTFDWIVSNAVSCLSNGGLGTFNNIPFQGPYGPVRVSIPSAVGTPYSQSITCNNSSGSVTRTVSVTVTGPPAQPALSITPSPTTNTVTSYTTDDTATISWTQPAGTTYYYALMGGVTATFAGCASGYGCQTSLTGISGRIGDAFTVGSGRFIEVRAYNASGYSAPSNRITFDVSSPAQTVNYTIRQTPAPGAGQQTVFPMAILLIDPPSVSITVPNQTSAQLTLWYSADGVAAQAAITSGVTWISNNPDIAVNSSGLVTTSLQGGGGDCVPESPNCVFYPNAVLGRAAIMAIYRDKISIGEVIVWGSQYRFQPSGGEGGNQ